MNERLSPLSKSTSGKNKKTQGYKRMCDLNKIEKKANLGGYGVSP